MNRVDVTRRGYWPACPTPFHRDGSYDPESHRALLELYLEMSVHGVLINGTTGEWFSQTPDERRLVAETAIDQVAGRVPVVVGCAAYTAREAAEIGRHAIAAGAAGIESTPPPYAKTYDDETVAYYEDLANGVDGPLLVYNWPHGTSIDIGPELASRLVEIDTVVALKDSTPNAEQFYETTKAVVDRVRIFGPFMSVEGFERLLGDGGDGFIGGGCIAVLGGVLAGRPRRLPGACRARRPAVPEALAAGRLGRGLRGVPEPAEGDHGDDRPARRLAASAPPAAD